MTTNLMKSSSQGVRDYPIDHNKKLSKNEDIDDVYDDPSNNPPQFDANKETVSKPPITKKRRIANKNHSVDAGSDPNVGATRDVVLRSRKFSYSNQLKLEKKYNHVSLFSIDLGNLAPEEQLDFMETENEKVREKVYQLAEALSVVVDKMKLKTENKPKQVFIRKNEDFNGNISFITLCRSSK